MFKKVHQKVSQCTRCYIGSSGPGLSRSGIDRKFVAGQVPRINRSQYKIYLKSLPKNDPMQEKIYKSSALPNLVPGALPSGWMPAPASIPDLPYFVWRKVDQTLPVQHKESEEFSRITEISKIEGDIQSLKVAVEQFLGDDKIPVVANEVMGTITCLGWRAFEIKKWLQLQGF